MTYMKKIHLMEHNKRNLISEWRKFRKHLVGNAKVNPERNLNESHKIQKETCRDYNRPSKSEMI